MRITYGKSVHGEDEIRAVNEVLQNSTQIGINVQNFENKISELFSKKYGVMVNSGSSALFLANKLINLPKDSEVITPVLTFATTVGSLIDNFLVPHFIDVELDTYCIDVSKIEENINSKTKALCIPNLIGNVPDWLELKRLADKYDLITIEDSADTLGSSIDNKSTGFYSDISITSFYGSHIINCAGNGGMLCFSDEKWYNEGRILRSWGRSSSTLDNSEDIDKRLSFKLDNIDYDAKFIFEKIGYNFEPSEVGAAFGLVQLNKLQENFDKRKKNFDKHLNFISNYDKIFVKPRILNNVNTNFLAFPLQLKNDCNLSRKELQKHLENDGIQTRVVFTGNILRQPGFKNIKYYSNYKEFVNADLIMKNGLLIGLHQGLNNDQIDYIHNSLKKFIDLN